jgi:hypothetical protein
VNGERVEDVYGVAAPIFDHRGEVNAALTVGGPRRRVTAKWDMMAAAVMDVASAVSAALGYHGRPQPGLQPVRNGRQSPAAGKRTVTGVLHTNGRSVAGAPSIPQEDAASNGVTKTPRIRRVKAPSVVRKTTSKRRTTRG